MNVLQLQETKPKLVRNKPGYILNNSAPLRYSYTIMNRTGMQVPREILKDLVIRLGLSTQQKCSDDTDQ